MINSLQIDKFHKDGFLHIENFYHLDRINEIKKSIHRIINIIIDHYQLDVEKTSFSSDNFDSSYMQLLDLDRRYGSIIYDAVKQIPAFNRLVNCETNQRLFYALRSKSLPSVASGGHGIRINNPDEEKYLAHWHQEYPAQLRSVNGLVFWSPLYDLKLENGPVIVAKESHKSGVFPVYFDGESENAYTLKIHDLSKVLKQYDRIQPLIKAGDVLIMDFCTLHKSGNNFSNRALWSMQFRWFDMLEETGINNDWQGSFAADTKFQDLHPELLIENTNFKSE